MRQHCFSLLAGTLMVAAMLTSCTASPGDPDPPEPPGSAPSTTVEAPETLTSNLDSPWSIAFYGDTALVSERDAARILEIGTDGTAREIGVIDGVAAGGEGGLLGIAVHEDHLYAYFTAARENRIERFELLGQPGALALGDAETILAGLPSATHHNGGRIAFGPDGMLYATVGDAGDQESAQDHEALSGKILRMTPDGDVPGDNPFSESLVYSYGHRNPQGIAWDENGTLYASEFGQDTWDELNIIQPGGNYGWPEVEGIAEQQEFIDPVQQWKPEGASPSGIAIVGNTIYIANLRGERLREVPLADPSVATEHFVGEYGRLRDIVVAPDGALWLLTNNTDGRGESGPDDDRILRIAR